MILQCTDAYNNKLLITYITNKLIREHVNTPLICEGRQRDVVGGVPLGLSVVRVNPKRSHACQQHTMRSNEEEIQTEWLNEQTITKTAIKQNDSINLVLNRSMPFS